jgi:hypothetical protein
LNFSYLSSYANLIGADTSDTTSLEILIEENRTVHALDSVGYKVLSFASGYIFTSIEQADVLYKPDWIAPNNFSHELIGTTMMYPLLFNLQYQWHRNRIQYIFDTLPDIARDPEPTFTYVHIVAPHPPFVFDSAGNPISPGRKFSIDDGSDFMRLGGQEEYVLQYKDQAQFIADQVRDVIRDILTLSSEEPIIVLQADHGPGSELDQRHLEMTNLSERFSILNAFYLPKHCSQGLYPEISPVNSLRVVFNGCFGTHYPLEPDRSYYSPIDKPFRFTDVTDALSSYDQVSNSIP